MMLYDIGAHKLGGLKNTLIAYGFFSLCSAGGGSIHNFVDF